MGIRGLHFMVADFIGFVNHFVAQQKERQQYWHSFIVKSL